MKNNKRVYVSSCRIVAIYIICTFTYGTTYILEGYLVTGHIRGVGEDDLITRHLIEVKSLF